MENERSVAAARSHLRAKAGQPLDPLPPWFAETREAMHLVAEEVLKPKRVLETGNEIALEFTPGGFGTPPWDRGKSSGRAGRIAVEGTELVDVDGEEVSRRQLEGADTEACAALTDWFAFGTVVLAELLERNPGLDPEPIRLWPEHFDVATVLGSEADNHRANYGASPGDADHHEPYLYVSLWDQSISGDPWDSTSFVGAELAYAEILVAEDHLAAGLAFLETRILR